MNVGGRYLVSDLKQPEYYNIINEEMNCDQMLGILRVPSRTGPWKIWANKSGLWLEASEFFLQNRLCNSSGSVRMIFHLSSAHLDMKRSKLHSDSRAQDTIFIYYKIANSVLTNENDV